MAGKSSLLIFLLFSLQLLSIAVSVSSKDGVATDLEEENIWLAAESAALLVKRGDWKSIVSSEDGEVSSVRIADGSNQLQFFTLEPDSLFLPVLLHTDMVFYVHTGSGRITWTDEDDLTYADLRRGDVYRLSPGTVFFLESSLETERSKLRIHAFFGEASEAYSRIHDMVLGFDKKVLQAAFQVSEEVIDEMLNGTKPEAIVHGVPREKRTVWEMEAIFMRGLLGSRGYNILGSNKKSKRKTSKLFNIFSEDKDFQNCNGWSTTVTRKRLSALKGSDIGIFMVNLTLGSMMGPHWNPRATEIAVVLQGHGMIRVICSSTSGGTDCKNARFNAGEGDVFAVPRFHPMAQMAFNNGSFVFMGISTSTKKNHPQFLAGKASVLQTLDKEVLALSFNVKNSTLDLLLAPQSDSVILGCASCAEEELRLMEEEIEKEKEAKRKREEEEARKKEEESRRQEEEARKREQEEARRQEEERRKREEEEEARKREEEEDKRKEEEEERKKREEEEEARKRKEEEAKRKEEEERRKREEEARKREEEEEAKRKEEAEERKRHEDEERRRQEEEEAKTRQEEEAAQRREQEQAAKEEEEAKTKEEEEGRKKEEEEARKREQEEEAKQREQEEEKKRQEEERRRQEEQEAQRRQKEEEAKRRQEEEEAQRREQEQAAKEEEAQRRQEEQEAQKREEEEEARRQQEQEEAQRRQQEQAAKEEEEERRRQEAWRRQEEEARRQQEEQERQQQPPGKSEKEQAAEEERRRQQQTEKEEEAARQQEGGSGKGEPTSIYR